LTREPPGDAASLLFGLLFAFGLLVANGAARGRRGAADASSVPVRQGFSRVARAKARGFERPSPPPLL
tara:strand:- start:256 stop:459 length:204 start_codon:yes stop_codon:yes gene_type:complete